MINFKVLGSDIIVTELMQLVKKQNLGGAK